MSTDKKLTYDEAPIDCVRRACAHLSEKEILEAEAVFRDYIRLVVDISDEWNEK